MTQVFRPDGTVIPVTLINAHTQQPLAEILETKKRLTTIYSTHAHPDHLFGLAVLKQAFPEAKIVALPATVNAAKTGWPARQKFWFPVYGNNIPGPEPVLPEESRRQTAMRGGLAWLDLECQRRHDKTFLACSEGERAAVLDDISWPAPDVTPGTVPSVPDVAPGRAFFFSFRDLTASGFWTTKVGMANLQFLGNRYVAEWTGCPDEALTKLGVKAP